MMPILRGAMAGAIATIPMTIPIIAAEKLGLFHTPPPVQISDRIARHSKLLPERAEPGFTPSWIAGHVGYGAVCGAIYALTRPVLPASTQVAGILFGGAVWGVSYLGYLPALNLYPSPDDDSKTRTATMIVAHAVFGIALAGLERRLKYSM